MKKKKKVDFSNLKKGECFRLTEKGPIYQKDNSDGGQCIFGKNVGHIIDFYFRHSKKVYPAKVKISEVK